MSLSQQLIDEMKQAMRDRNKIKLSVIRYLRSGIKNYEIDHGQQDDAGIEKIVTKQAKQVKESIEEYKKAGRDDLVLEEKAKLKILEEYLPEQMSDEEIQVVINEVLKSIKNPQIGPVIGQVMGKVQGKADGSKVSELVRQTLAS
ncbi:GatB/YqeY domain-containing protein [Patescibacteria group bacterium]|nr:GatB/YqeY domain-containing protein [Patescibacteria group bacterium]MBU1885915.1 GatB/YqeY domain-containing protein [Patescibacteria group bacterium]